MPYALALRRRVQFYETDAAGIVHFSTFFRYMEEAEHALWREAGLSVFPPEPTHGWPRVAASFDYRRPLRFEDEFEIRIEVTQVSVRSMTYACRVVCRGELVADGRMTIACVERQADHSLKSVAIPAAIAALFRPPSATGPASASPSAGHGAASPPAGAVVPADDAGSPE